MKKMLIISTRPHWYPGGIETYTNSLIEIFKSDYEILEICVDTDLNKKIANVRGKQEIKTKILKYSNFYNKNYRFAQKKYIKKTIKQFNPSVIINNVPFFFWKNLAMDKRYIHVQHFDYRIYDVKKSRTKSLKFKLWLDKYFLKLTCNKNPLETASKAVVFPKSIEKLENKKNRIEIAPAFSEEILIKKNKPNNQAISIGVLNKGKNPTALNNIAKKISSKIIVIGEGNEKYALNSNNLILKGRLPWSEANNLLQESKVFVMTSLHEGMPLVLIESLSCGVPIILYNSFTTANFFKNKSSFIFETGNEEQFAKKIDEIINMGDKEWLKLSYDAQKFAQKNFTKKIFEEKWKKIVNL